MNDEDYAVVEPEETEMTFAAKIAGIFLDPERTFISLDKKPDFYVPLVILAVFATVFTYFAMPVISQFHMDEMIKRTAESDISPEQLQRIADAGRTFGLISPPIFVFIGALIISGLLLFAGNIIIGGNQKFVKVLSIYSYTALIGVIAYAVKLPLILSKNTLEVYTSPALFFPASAKDTMAFKIAALLDLFTIWQIIVISIGMAVIYKITFQKSASVIGTMFVIYAAVAIIFGSRY